MSGDSEIKKLPSRYKIVGACGAGAERARQISGRRDFFTAAGYVDMY